MPVKAMFSRFFRLCRPVHWYQPTAHRCSDLSGSVTSQEGRGTCQGNGKHVPFMPHLKLETHLYCITIVHIYTVFILYTISIPCITLFLNIISPQYFSIFPEIPRPGRRGAAGACYTPKQLVNGCHSPIIWHYLYVYIYIYIWVSDKIISIWK